MMSKLTSMASVRLLLTPEEAAEALGIKRTMMFELLSNRRVESVKIGRTRRVPIAALHEYFERLRGCSEEEKERGR
jgi:excisionase family DNA binding protein